MSGRVPCLPYRSFNERLGRPFGNTLRAFGGQSPNILQHDQHLDTEDEGERLCKAFPQLGGTVPCRGAVAHFSRSTRWPRLNSGSLPSVPAWRCAHWSSESFSAAFKGGLKLVDARHRGRQQVGDAGTCIGTVGRPVKYGPQSFIHHGMHEHRLAGK